jgi:hypothetical protein
MEICEYCGGTGWEPSGGGVTPCRCRPEKTPQKREYIPDEAIFEAVKGLAVMSYFPSDPVARTVIGDAIASMCPSVEALRYLVRRACASHKTWDHCGIEGLRQAVCSRYYPADGIECFSTESYPEGLPSEHPPSIPALPSGAQKALPEPHPGAVSADPEMDAMVKKLAKKVRF